MTGHDLTHATFTPSSLYSCPWYDEERGTIERKESSEGWGDMAGVARNGEDEMWEGAPRTQGEEGVEKAH
jgi:hypothetical protein